MKRCVIRLGPCVTMLIVTLLVSTAMPLRAADEEALSTRVDRIARPYIDSGLVVGLTIGLVDSTGSQVFSYGKRATDDDRTPDSLTIYEIGSITKVFTSLSLADMSSEEMLPEHVAGHGSLDLDTPVQMLLPDTIAIPRYKETEITLLDLATHTSGLPRMPGNFRPMSFTNPYADYSPADLYDFFAGHTLASKPGSSYEYSNVGAGLLGHALARHADTSYEVLIVTRICKPIGMADTRVSLSAGQAERLAPGHDAEGNRVSNWDFLVLAGAGALRSNVRDMLMFLRANFRLTDSPLKVAIETTHVPRRDIDETEARIAMGWHVGADGTLWHNGQTGGYHSFIAFRKDLGIGVVVLSNSAVMAIDSLGDQLMKLLAEQPVQSSSVRIPIKLLPLALERYVGKYRFASGAIIEVARQDEGLIVHPPGQPQARLYAESETSFFLRVADATVTFQIGEDDEVTRLTWTQGWRRQIAEKVE